MAERCSRCHRKKFAAGRATHADLCHRTASPECLAAEAGFARGLRTMHGQLRAVVQVVCHDDEDQVLDSMGVDELAKAMRSLAELGSLRIDADRGPHVVGRWA